MCSIRFGKANATSILVNKDKKKKIVGSLRRSQLITTFGSGAIVEMPEYSVVIAGTDQWNKNSKVLHEANLEKLLQVKYFKEPYVDNNRDNKLTEDIPVFRFPYYHYCPECGSLKPYWEFGDTSDRSCSNGHDKKRIIPSRFVVACINGHLEDFPYNWWVHHGDFSKCSGKHKKSNLKISFSEATGNLDSIIIECLDCKASRSMLGCMDKNALKGYHCSGKRPWLGIKKYDSQKCTAQLRSLQRGATNIYFPVMSSALTIPPWSSKINQEIDKNWDRLQEVLNSKIDLENLRLVIKAVFYDFISYTKYTADDILKEVLKRHSGKNCDKYTKQNLLEDEYQVFCKGNYSEKDDVQFRIESAGVPDFLVDYLDDVVLVKRLREVLALRGFRRISPEEPNSDDEKFNGYNLEHDCIPLSEENLNWLPAIELLGEGIFIRFNEDLVSAWEEKHIDYYKIMKHNLDNSVVVCENFSARYVFLHTLSHLLIRQLSLECGYSGASIKERIYSTYSNSDVKMAGILIYTSTPDADGSLGGLVRNGRVENFANFFRNMFQEALWCSSDPICIESQAQGYESLNYAACHACTLLPETSCEMRNCLLDRCAIVGHFNDRSKGLFSSLLYDN